MRRASLFAVAALALVAACKGKGKGEPRPGPDRPGAGSAPAAVDAAADGLPRCVTTLERAARLVPLERAGAIVRGCALCGGAYDPLIAADLAVDGGPIDREAVWAIVEACGGVCSSSAATRFKQDLAELGLGHPTITPWRTLAEACPAIMQADDQIGRFASGAWYALATVAARLGQARPTLPADLATRLDGALAELVLPLPPRSVTGNPLALPSGAGGRATPWLALSIVGPDVYLGRLPFARLTAGRLEVVGQPLYPGTITPLAGLPAAVTTALGAGAGFAVSDPAGRLDRPVLLAGSGGPAARVLALVTAVGDDPSYLAVTTAAPASMWPGQLAAHPVALAARDPVKAPHLRIGLTSARVAAVDAAGKVVASAELPGADQPMAARLYAAAAAMAPGGVIEVVAETGTVADLAALLDAALRGGAAGVIPAPAGAALTGRPLPAFDGPALRAKVTP